MSPYSSWRRHGNVGRRDDEPWCESEGGRKRRQRSRQRAPQTKGTQLTFIVLQSFFCNSLTPSRFYFCFVVFFDLSPLMKQTKSDQHMLPQHSGMFLSCFLAISNDLFNIYHSWCFPRFVLAPSTLSLLMFWQPELQQKNTLTHTGIFVNLFYITKRQEATDWPFQ